MTCTILYSVSEGILLSLIKKKTFHAKNCESSSREDKIVKNTEKQPRNPQKGPTEL